MRRLVVLTVVAAFALPLAPPGVAGATFDVAASGEDAAGGAFSPSFASISLGDRIEWKNAASTARHTITSTSTNWNVNRDLAPGDTFGVTFPSTGTFGYRCLYHSSMTGQVAVAKGLDADLVVTVLGPPVNLDTGSRDVTYTFNVTGVAAHPTDAILRVQWRETTAGTTAWTAALLEDAGAWSFSVDVSGTANGATRSFQIRAETANAFSAAMGSVTVRVVHTPYTIELVSPALDEGNVLHGRVPVVVRVTHPYWSPGTVSVTLSTTTGGVQSPPGWPAWYGNTSVTHTTQVAQTGAGTTDLVRGGSLYTLSALSGAQAKWPEGKWDTYRLADGTYDIQVNVAPKDSGSQMFNVAHYPVVVDNRVDVTKTITTSPGRNANTVAGAIQLTGTLAHWSKPVNYVRYAATSTGVTCAATVPATGVVWREASLGSGTWTFGLDTAIPAEKIRNNQASCLYVRAGTSPLSPSATGTHGYTHEDWFTFPFTANNTERRDVRFAATPVATTPTQEVAGTPVGTQNPSITYKLTNDGNTQTSVQVKFQARSATVGWHDLGNPVTVSVQAYSTTGTQTFPWPSSAPTIYVGTWEVRGIVDPANTVKETSEDPTADPEGNNISNSFSAWVTVQGEPRRLPS